MLTDMHCHLQDQKIFPYISNIIEKAKLNKVTKFLCCGTSEFDWPKVLELHSVHRQIIPAIGIHPWAIEHISKNWESNLKTILTKHSECLIGEVGLDLHFWKKTEGTQIEILIKQFEIAREFDRPVCLHNLKAWHILLPIIKKFNDRKILLHSYSGSFDITKQLLEMANIFFSFSGIILDNQKQSLQKIINIIPDNRLLIETDSPFLLPRNIIIKNRDYNEPANLIFVLEKIAKIKNITPDKLIEQLSANSEFFIKG